MMEVVCKIFLVFSAWNKQGLNNLKHIAERTKKREHSIFHMHTGVDFSVLGKVEIRV